MNYNQEMDLTTGTLDVGNDPIKSSGAGKIKSFWQYVNTFPLKDKIFFHYGWIGFIVSILLAIFVFPSQFLFSGKNISDEYPSVPSYGVDHGGEHCDNNRIIINYGVVDCATATKITDSYDFHQANTVVINNFTCAPPLDIAADHYFDVWCTRLYRNAITSFFASENPEYYAHFPAGFSHWLPDVSAYVRLGRPGIDFRTEANTIQCIVTGERIDLLECAGVRIPGNDRYTHMPNNMVVFSGKRRPVPNFGSSAEFSYGQRRVLSAGNTIFYKNFICSATATQMRCANVAPIPHGFTVSPQVFNSY